MVPTDGSERRPGDPADADAAETLSASLAEQFHESLVSSEQPTVVEFRTQVSDPGGALDRALQAERALDRAIEPNRTRALPHRFGEYLLRKELGRGAMGVVYEALHVSLNRSVAIKVLKTDFETRPDAIDRFRREGRACAAVRHPNVVEIYDAGVVEGRPYYAMELIPGTSLDVWSRTQPQLDLPAVFSGFAGVADALHVMHQAGIVHRDIKPANIMVRPDGTMVLADFGLARMAAGETLTATGALVGTPLYMSPEQMMGLPDAVDGRADIYSLGASLYEVLARTAIFTGSSVSAIMQKVLHERPQDLGTRRPDLPRQASVVVMKSLEKRREDRYQNAAEFAADLRALAAGSDVRAKPVPTVVRASRALRMRWAAVAAVVVAGVVGAVFVGASHARAPGTLELASFPEAEVLLDGAVVGRTRMERAVEPGEYTLTLRQPGFQDRTEKVVIAPGTKASLERVMIVRPDAGQEAMAQLANSLGVTLADTTAATARVRAGADDGTPIRLMTSGLVGRAALRSVRVRVGASFDADGELRFVVAGKTVHAVDFDPELSESTIDVPPAVALAAGADGVIEWGYHPRQGAATTARITLASPESDVRLAALEARLAQQPGAVARQIRSRFFISERRYAEALEEAAALLAGDGADEQARRTADEAAEAMDADAESGR